MATRHQARTAVVGLLYAYDLGNEDIAKFSDVIFEEDKIRNKQRVFSKALFKGTIENIEVVDAEVQKYLKGGWDYKSIGKVEKAIMRLATYEILIEGTNKRIVINEAIELAKALADDKSPKFINAVLDAVGKEDTTVEEPTNEIKSESEES